MGPIRWKLWASKPYEFYGLIASCSHVNDGGEHRTGFEKQNGRVLGRGIRFREKK